MAYVRRVWTGDIFFEKKPDIPAGLTKLSQLRDSYALLLGEKFRVVDCRVQSYDGVPAVWLIVGGLEPESHTAIYVGSITIPFRNFSYVIKMQASERGTTGMRETLLVARALKDGTGSIQDGKFVPHGWSVDDEQFDSLVPQHPLSRLRRELCSIASSINIDGKVKREAPFALPPNISQN